MQIAPVLDELAAYDGFEKLLLAAEIAVDRFLRDTGAARHRVDARASISVLQKILGCDVEHFLLFGFRLRAAFAGHSHGARHAAQAGGALPAVASADSFLAVGID